MTGLFERALGEDWDALHPQLQERYGVDTSENREVVGTGEMRQLTRSVLALPILWLGTVEDFLFPESGTDVPFTITTEAFVDDNGHEALVLERHFETNPPRDFVDTLRWNPERGCITDYLGRNGHIAADIYMNAEDDSLSLSLGTQWLRARGRYITLPGLFSVDASLYDWYDDDSDKFRVTAEIRNPLIGKIFGYEGWFENSFQPASSSNPADRALGSIDLPGENA